MRYMRRKADKFERLPLKINFVFKNAPNFASLTEI